MIVLESISKTYRYRDKIIPVFTEIDAQVYRGEALCVCGSSGSGKTTLLNIVGGMLAPTSGAVRVNDVDITALPGHFRAAYRRNQVGFVFQPLNLLSGYTVMENLFFPLIPSGVRVALEKGRLLTLLDRFGVAHRADFPVQLLSGGEQQRVAIARALVLDPEIIIADEPYANIDETNARVVLDILLELKNEGKSIIFSSFSVSGSDSNLVDKVIKLHAE